MLSEAMIRMIAFVLIFFHSFEHTLIKLVNSSEHVKETSPNRTSNSSEHLKDTYMNKTSNSSENLKDISSNRASNSTEHSKDIHMNRASNSSEHSKDIHMNRTSNSSEHSRDTPSNRTLNSSEPFRDTASNMTSNSSENLKEILSSHSHKEFVIKPQNADDNSPVILFNFNASQPAVRSSDGMLEPTNAAPACLIFSSNRLKETNIGKFEEKIERINDVVRIPNDKMDQVYKKCEPKHNETDNEIIEKVNYTYYAGAIVLGTKWCGSGSIAKNQEDLGLLSNLDMCCREHDNCPDLVKSKETKEELWNPTAYTRLSCDCDEKFRRCLHDVRNNHFERRYSDMVGVVYFDLYNNKCYKKEPPIVCCKRFNWWRTKCLDYDTDSREPPVKQWQNTPTYFSPLHSHRSQSGTDLDVYLRKASPSALPPSCYS